jgi:DNA repair protein RecO (recombination protein O)
MSQLMFCTELIHKTVKEEEQNEALYDFIQNTINDYDAQFSSNVDFHLFFLAGLSSFLGIQPHLNHDEERRYFNLHEACFQTFEDLNCLAETESYNFFKLFSGAPFSLSNTERRLLLTAILSYYQSQFPHMGKIKSVEVLQQVFKVA